MKITFIVIIIMFFCETGMAQQNMSSNQFIQNKLHSYSKIQEKDLLFLHTDKSIYTNNETIWFSSYFLISNAKDKHSILSIFLSKDVDNSVVLSRKIVIQKNFASGGLVLPDTIPPGNYHMNAYSNVLDKKGDPVLFFSASIVIKSIKQTSFKTELSLLDSNIKDGKIRAQISLDRSGAKAKEFPTVQYKVGTSPHFSSVMKSDQMTITIPESRLKGSNNNLNAIVSFNGQKQYLTLRLPQQTRNGAKVRFFPEGGNLSANLSNSIAWESIDVEGSPVSATALLYKNDKVVDTVKTDNNGMGQFFLTPEVNASYSLRLRKNGYQDSDTSFTLPSAINNSIALHMAKGVANDTISVNLSSTVSQNVQVLLHQINGMYIIFRTKVSTTGHTLNLPITMLSKGLATLSILDDRGRPLAERVFFARYKAGPEATVSLGKKIYGKREIAKVDIKVLDQKGNPVQGVFSIAVVQSNRILNSLYDIENTYFLGKNISSSEKDPLGLGFHNEQYLENILRIKAWRRYTWRTILGDSGTDTIQTHNVPDVSGIVQRNNKPLKEPVNIIPIGGVSSQIIKTNFDGKFKVSQQLLYAEDEKKVLLSVGEKNPSAYKISIYDPYKIINQRMANQLEIASSVKKTSNSVENYVLPGIERMFNLETITVTASKNSNSIYGFKGEPGSNACGDYVDPAGHLNYEYTPSKDRYKPIVGKLYTRKIELSEDRVWFRVEPVYYTGCTTSSSTTTIALDGIYADKEFYGVNNASTEPQYKSTLLWKSGLITDSTGSANISFETGDIADQFKIIIQGITTNDIFSATKSFTVK